MFLYKFGYGSYEESCFYEVCHKKQFSEEEFNSIVIDAIIKVLQDFVDGKRKLYVGDEGISYDEIHEYVFEELKKIGFEEGSVDASQLMAEIQKRDARIQYLTTRLSEFERKRSFAPSGPNLPDDYYDNDIYLAE